MHNSLQVIPFTGIRRLDKLKQFEDEVNVDMLGKHGLRLIVLLD